MFFYSRVLSVSGAVPKPGEDITGAAWQQHMRAGEVAIFVFDAKSGQFLGPRGEIPQIPVQEVCMVFGSRYAARLSARGQVRVRPHKICVLYDRHGRWLGAFSAEGETRRNPGLGLAWLLFQFPLMALYGTLAILAIWAIGARYFGVEPLRWEEMSQPQLTSLLGGGLWLGAFGRLLFEWIRKRLVIWHGKPARAPLGSREREKMYQRLAKNEIAGLRVPMDVTLVAAAIEWPYPEKYEAWSAVLRDRGFRHVGQFFIPEIRGSIDFWFSAERDLTAAITTVLPSHMSIAVFTRYEDQSSFSVVNTDWTGLDVPPEKKVVHLGPEATAETVLERALNERPEGARRRPTEENVLEDFTKNWQKHIEWRRTRGTTAEEYKRVDERRHEREKRQAAESQ